jgi:hypothetical protein
MEAMLQMIAAEAGNFGMLKPTESSKTNGASSEA